MNFVYYLHNLETRNSVLYLFKIEFFLEQSSLVIFRLNYKFYSQIMKKEN